MKKHILLDIEALGRRPGCGITELGAVEFFPETGEVGRTFSSLINPQAPYTADLETLDWHKRKGTWPRMATMEDVLPIGPALVQFEEWFADAGEVEAVWAWGATYDFPILAAAYDLEGLKMPWDYWQQQCARTVWRVAFGERKHDPRPHRALEDARAGAVDLMEAMSRAQRKDTLLDEAQDYFGQNEVSPTEGWWKRYFLHADPGTPHMVLTEEGWEHASSFYNWPEGDEKPEFLDEVNAPEGQALKPVGKEVA
jgi:hypothetical protein